MNERFKELLEQTDIPHFPILGSLAWVATDHDMKKFAELIVRECISTLEEKIHRSIDNEGDEIWADLILKEHFGVEE
jgi:hypothetical protein